MHIRQLEQPQILRYFAFNDLIHFAPYREELFAANTGGVETGARKRDKMEVEQHPKEKIHPVRGHDVLELSP